MKKVILALVCALSFLETAQAFQAPRFLDQMAVNPPQGDRGGGEVPFPIGQRISFPWSTIQGMWQVEDPQTQAHFSFEVARDVTATMVLKIIQLDPVRGEIDGQGIGYVDQEGQTVRAAMRGKNSNYLLLLRAFRTQPASVRTDNYALVLTVRTYAERGRPEREWHFRTHKVTNTPARPRR